MSRISKPETPPSTPLSLYCTLYRLSVFCRGVEYKMDGEKEEVSVRVIRKDRSITFGRRYQ